MRKIYFLLLAVLCAAISNAQLTGTKNIPGDYATLAAAITDLNAQGVGPGGVTLNLVAANPQTAPAGGYAITATGTLANQITIAGNGNTITAPTPQASGALNDAIFKIIGGDYVTIDGFVMLENAANTTTAAATNNMTEWGVAVLYATTTDGAQNVTIQNNTIDLDRTYQNTSGIYSNSTHAATTPTTSATATTSTGGNSGLKIYTNIITDVNQGIIVVGPTAAADNNDGLDIGGSTPGTGNAITNFGTTGTFSAYANVATATANAVLIRNTKNYNVAYNTISSSNGGNTAGALRGVYVPSFSNAPTGTISNSINNNEISLRSAVAAGIMNSIHVEATTVNATTSLSINNNNFHTTTHTVAGTAAINFILQASASLNTTINNNTFTNLTVNTTGSVTFISNSVTHPANGVTIVNNNSVVTGFSKTGAGGTLQFYLSNSLSPTTTTETNAGNNFSNISVTGATTIAGWQSTDGSGATGPVKTITNNTFNNITGGTSGVTLLSVSFSTLSNVSGNTVSNVSSGGAITGITTSSGNDNFFQNTVHTLSSTGASAVTGFAVTGGTTKNIHTNKIYNLSASNAGSTVNGILASTIPTSLNVYNNLVGDLRNTAASGNDVIRGISITGVTATTSVNIHFNSIYINATSSGANFGTSGIFATTSATATTASLTLRNNIIVNTSTAAGTGLTVAYRRSSTALNNYSAASNNNLYYAGTPSATNLIFYDGTNSDQTLAAFKLRVLPADANSVTENPPFLSTTGSSPDFLHINSATPTQAESGGIPVAGVAIDFDGNTRNAGTPDIGADEFSGLVLDLLPPTITYTPLTFTCVTTARTLTATITDISGVPTAGAGLPVLYWRINAGAYTAATATSLGSNQYQFTFGAGVVLGDVVSYYIVAQDNASTPNVGSFPIAGAGGFTANPPAAATPPTTPSSYSVSGALSGTYNVGAGQTYTTLTAAVNAYNNSCLGGAVIFNLVDATYPSETFPIVVNQHPEASATNTLTIKPGTTATISGSLNNSAIIKILGNYVTINGSNNLGTSRDLTITNTSVTGPSVLWFGSTGTTPITNSGVRNTIIINGSNTASALIVSDGATLAAAGYFNNITIQNNSIQRAFIGAYNIAVVAPGNGSGLLITGNDLNTAGANSIRLTALYLQGVDGATVSNNNIGGIANTADASNITGIWFATGTVNSTITGNTILTMSGTSSAPRGIVISSGVASANVTVANNTITDLTSSSTGTTTGIFVFTATSGVTVEKNRITNIRNTNTTGFGSNGIQLGSTLTAANITVSNNFISEIFADGFNGQAVGDNGYGIILTSGGGYNIYYNTVSLNANQTEVGGLPAAINITSGITTAGSVNIVNNIFSNTQTIGTQRYAILSGAANTVYGTIDYNDYHTTGPNLGFIGSNRADLAAIQAGFGGNANSKSVAPVFVSVSDLHLVPASNTGLNNLGLSLPGITTDIDNDTRSTNVAPQGPDMGADEFLGLCTGAEGGTAAGGTTFCGSGTPTITATGYSAGTDAGYQWQSSNDNFVGNIVDIPGQTNPASLTTGVVSSTTYYRLRVTCPTGTAIDYSNTIIVEVNTAPAISADPASTAVCAGATAAFSVTLSNPGPFTYQWQENTGSGFTNIPSATNPALSFIASAGQNGYQYRVLVTNTCGTTTSNPALLTVSANPVATIAYGQTLYASDNAGNLYRINTTTGAGTLVGNFDGAVIGATEIEYDFVSGKAYAQGSGNNNIYEININTGAYIGPLVNTGAVHAGLEYVGSTLYGTSFVAPLGPSSLVTLNPVTGVSTPIGLTGVGAIAGLAYDLTTGTMYGIAGGGGPAGLFTINLSTGVATLIGSTGIQAGSLQFGPDGRLYAGGTGGTNAGNIYTINTTTGAATLLGATGTINGITGLALANIPAVFCSSAGTIPVILTGSTGGAFTSSPAGLSVDPVTGAVNGGTSTAGTYTVTYTIPAVGSCAQVVTSAPITINSAPVVAPITGPSTVCSGQTITLSSATPGGSWSSTNTAAATVDPVTGVVTGVSAGSTTINYTVVAGCSTVVSAGVSVLAGPPTPVITPAAPVICAGTVQALSISSGASTVTFNGGAITLPAGAPGTTSGPAGPYPATIAVSGLPASGVTVKSVTINGFTHTFPDDLDILLQSPTGTNVVLMSDAGLGDDINNVNYTFDDAAAALMLDNALNPTGTYRPTNFVTPDTWAAPGPGAVTQANPTLGSFSGNFNGTWNLFIVDDAGGDVGTISSWSIVFDISPIVWSPLTGLFTNAAGTIPYTGTSASTVYASPATTTTYTASNSSGGCTASSTVTVTVNPIPNVNVVSNQAVCHGASTTAVTFSGTVPGTVYNWTNSAPSIGLAASGTGNIASFVATNTGAAPVVATITVTPTYTNAGTTCTGTARTFTITVNPNLAITTQPANSVVCAGVTATFNVVVSGAPTYQWQVNTGSGFVNVTNTPPYTGATTNTLTITGPTTTMSGNTYQVIITSPCGNTTSSVATLTVNPLPTIAVGPNGLCAPVTLTATGTSNTYSWAPATGLSATTGATVTATPTANTIYTVTGTLTATGCQNSATVTVLGTPPAVVVTPAAPSICAGAIQQLSVPGATATYSNNGTITIPFGAPGTTSGSASLYPSSITVAGLPATGVTVRSVTVNGVTHTFPDDIDMLLQSPTGTNVVLMSDAGGGDDITGRNFIFEDGAAAAMLDGAANASGTYRPTNFGTPDTWAAPGPGSVTQATPLLSSFTGNPNGNWGLFIADDAGGDIGSVSSWSITFNIPTATWTPVTGLFTDPAGTIPYTAGTILNTVYASPAATTTYTVNSSLGTCSVPSGTVTVTVNPRPTISVTPNNQCSPVTLTATGTSNTYSWSPAAGLSATTGATVTATPTVNTVYTVTGTITATGCTNTATVTVNATPPAPVVTPSAVSICAGAITQLTAASGNGTATATSGTIAVAIPDNTPAGINHVLNLASVPAGATITGINVNFNVTHTFDGDLIFNLKAPNGNTLNLVNRRGGGGDNFVNTTISSTGVTAISAGTAPFTGIFLPDGTNGVGPTGFVSNVTAFSNLLSVPNGDWTLAINDNAGIDIGTLTSWTINITYTLPDAIWSPVTGLFTDPSATIPYVANTPLNVVYAKPATTTTYTVRRATATCSSANTSVTVTVLAPVTITTQPANVSTCIGANATFSVVATGNVINYQWQLSTDGGTTWNNIAGATNASLVVPNVTAAMSTNRYRVIITNSCNTVTSNAATLTVSAPTAPTVTALQNRICLTDTLIPLVGLPVGGTWSGVGVSGNNFVPSATAVGTYTLTYSYTNPAGCTSTATTVAKVEDCPERIIRLTDNAVILYPNPNNGRFNIRINSTLYNYLGMKVYNAQGQLLSIQQFGGLVYGRVVPINLSNLPSGVYMVKFYYDDGARSSDKTFKVVIAR